MIRQSNRSTILCFIVLALSILPTAQAQAEPKIASSDGIDVEYFTFGSGAEAVLMAPSIVPDALNVG